MKMKGTKNGKPKLTQDGGVKKPKKTKKLEKAETAVAKYEELKTEYLTAQDSFQKKYPQAYNELQAIREQEDAIREQIEACKILVRDAGQSIGEFTCTKRFTSEGYIGKALLELLAKLPPEETGELFQELHERGFFNDVKIDKAAAKVIRASDAELRERLQPAWDKGGDELTAAVSTPKI